MAGDEDASPDADRGDLAAPDGAIKRLAMDTEETCGLVNGEGGLSARKSQQQNHPSQGSTDLPPMPRWG